MSELEAVMAKQHTKYEDLKTQFTELSKNHQLAHISKQKAEEENRRLQQLADTQEISIHQL